MKNFSELKHKVISMGSLMSLDNGQGKQVKMKKNILSLILWNVFSRYLCKIYRRSLGCLHFLSFLTWESLQDRDICTYQFLRHVTFKLKLIDKPWYVQNNMHHTVLYHTTPTFIILVKQHSPACVIPYLPCYIRYIQVLFILNCQELKSKNRADAQ